MQPELKVMCPKCKAGYGEPCRSIRHGGPLTMRVYTVHKKRRAALYVGALVLSPHMSAAVPVRLTGRSLPQVGPVDSAAKSLGQV